MGATLDIVRVELDLGAGGAFQADAFQADAFEMSGYVDVSDDLVAVAGLGIEYGIQGNGPLDRVADPGTLEFVLKNHAGNSAGKQGYYSPNHENCRPGFGYEIPVRAYLGGGGVLKQKFAGRLHVIDPVPGAYRQQVTHCVAYDVIYDLVESDVREIPPQINKTEVELIEAVLDAVPTGVAPAAVDFDAALETFPYAFHDVQTGEKAIGLIRKAAVSAWGWVVAHGDGTLRYINRQAHLGQTPEFHFDNVMTGLDAPTDLSGVYNDVRVTYHPKTLGATNTEVLFAASEVITIAPGDTIERWVTYSDPANRDRIVGGTDFQTPLTAGTDYLANTAANGSGTVITASIGIVASCFASTAKLLITNNHASTAYLVNTSGVPTLQIRGRGIYDLSPVTVTAASGRKNRPLRIDLPYQGNGNTAVGFATHILREREAMPRGINEITFNPHESAALMALALECEPGDLVTVTETVNGFREVPVLIHSVHLRVTEGRWIERCTFGVAPIVVGTPWILEDPVHGVLDETTILSHV